MHGCCKAAFAKLLQAAPNLASFLEYNFTVESVHLLQEDECKDCMGSNSGIVGGETFP